MADSLKARIRTMIEAEHIRDLDVDDPIRDIATELDLSFTSSGILGHPGTANRIWIKQLDFLSGDRCTFDMWNGTYQFAGGPVQNMLDGFGQTVTFSQLGVLQVKVAEITYPPFGSFVGASTVIMASAVTPFTRLLENFAVNTGFDLMDMGCLTLTAGGILYSVSNGAPFGCSFDVFATAPYARKIEITLIGNKL